MLAAGVDIATILKVHQLTEAAGSGHRWITKDGHKIMIGGGPEPRNPRRGKDQVRNAQGRWVKKPVRGTIQLTGTRSGLNPDFPSHAPTAKPTGPDRMGTAPGQDQFAGMSRAELAAANPELAGAREVEGEDPADKLGSSSVKDAKSIKVGVTDGTEIITFNDGTKGFWKPSSGEDSGARRNISDGLLTEREVGAWKLGEIVGMQDLGTPVKDVMRITLPDGTEQFVGTEKAQASGLKGERGALMQLQPGDNAKEFGDAVKYDGLENLGRSAAYDYVIGNEDRHDKNWMVEEGTPPETSQLHMIDHNLSFPDLGPYQQGHQMIIDQAQRVLADHEGYAPSDFSQPYVQNVGKIEQAILKVGLPQESANGVKDRIELLANAKGWNRLKGAQ